MRGLFSNEDCFPFVEQYLKGKTLRAIPLGLRLKVFQLKYNEKEMPGVCADLHSKTPQFLEWFASECDDYRVYVKLFKRKDAPKFCRVVCKQPYFEKIVNPLLLELNLKSNKKTIRSILEWIRYKGLLKSCREKLFLQSIFNGREMDIESCWSPFYERISVGLMGRYDFYNQIDACKQFYKVVISNLPIKDREWRIGFCNTLSAHCGGLRFKTRHFMQKAFWAFPTFYQRQIHSFLLVCKRKQIPKDVMWCILLKLRCEQPLSRPLKRIKL